MDSARLMCGLSLLLGEFCPRKIYSLLCGLAPAELPWSLQCGWSHAWNTVAAEVGRVGFDIDRYVYCRAFVTFGDVDENKGKSLAEELGR